MSYTPTVWNTGDTITAEKLNKLENGVAVLSNYDIVFTHGYDENDNDVFTADGLSIEELYQEGIMNLNGVLIDEGYTIIKPFSCTSYIEDGVTSVGFYFMSIRGASLAYRIRSDGTAYISGENATYTYSNGHYVFTLGENDGEGGGGGGNPNPSHS